MSRIRKGGRLFESDDPDPVEEGDWNSWSRAESPSLPAEPAGWLERSEPVEQGREDRRLRLNPERGRFDRAHERYDQALMMARREAGKFGEDRMQMHDPVSGTLIGERSSDGRRGWRIDRDHVNWWDWTDGKKGSGGRFGHEFFPDEQSGPHSKYLGYAPWESGDR